MPRIEFTVDGETLRGDVDLPRAGAGPWPGVVLLHGMCSCVREFQDLPDRLNRAGYAVLGYDVRGAGASDGPRGFITKERWVADARAALAVARAHPAFNAARLAAVGHSMGGMTLLAAAADGAVPLGALVVAASPVSIKEEATRRDRWLGGVAYLLTRPLDLLRTRPCSYPNPVRYEHVVSDPIRARELADQDLYLRRIPLASYPHLMRFTCGAEAARGVLPALFLLGEQDRLVRPAHTRRLHDRYGGPKELACFAQSGHSLFADREKVAVAERVIAFLDRWRADRDPA